MSENQYKKLLFTRPKEMTLESFYAFNNSRVNLKGFSECQNSHFIKQFCFAPNCEPEFMSTLKLLNENHS